MLTHLIIITAFEISSIVTLFSDGKIEAQSAYLLKVTLLLSGRIGVQTQIAILVIPSQSYIIKG